MKLTKNDIIAGGGTLLAMVLLCVFLLCFGMSANTPLTEEGLSVNFGMVELSQGLFEPYSPQPQPTPQPNPVPAVTTPPAQSETPAEQELITQDDEPSVDLEAQAEAKRKAEEELRRHQEEERKRQEQERQAEAIKSQVANAFGSQRGSESQNQGFSDQGSGNQGQAQGNPESFNTSGAGSGYGDFSLDGRSHIGSLPRPSFNIEAEGVVMVRILVDNEGKVINASIDLEGTDTDNIALRNAALAAAKQARFNAINSKTNQSGSITYRFRLK